MPVVAGLLIALEGREPRLRAQVHPRVRGLWRRGAARPPPTRGTRAHLIGVSQQLDKFQEAHEASAAAARASRVLFLVLASDSAKKVLRLIAFAV
jgi:hypothetical protein